jgi:transcriptional regulator with XRE-family HTH domain
MFKHSLGEVIKDFRVERCLTQRQLAAKAFISHNYLSEIERGVKELSSEILENLAAGMEVPSYDLIIEAGYRMAEVKVPDTYQEFMDEQEKLLVQLLG